MLYQLFTLLGSSMSSDEMVAGMLTVFFAYVLMALIPALIVAIVMIIGLWKVFVKAGREGWEAIVPIYNIYVLTEISGQSGWLFLICLIPGIGSIIWSIMVATKLAPAFGKGGGFAVGLVLLAPIFYCILGFGDATYLLGNNAATAATPQPTPTGDPAATPQSAPTADAATGGTIASTPSADAPTNTPTDNTPIIGTPPTQF